MSRAWRWRFLLPKSGTRVIGKVVSGWEKVRERGSEWVKLRQTGLGMALTFIHLRLEAFAIA